jgi:hypothetical protein
MPFTHSLPGALALSAIFAGFVAMLVAMNRTTVFPFVAAACFSHWVLDLGFIALGLYVLLAAMAAAVERMVVIGSAASS